jgi:phytol kinase
VVFVTLAWLLSLIAFLLLSDVGRGEAIVLALITALFGALLEAASWRGLDNLFIPLGLYFILSNLMMVDMGQLLATTGVFAVALAGVFTLGPRLHVSRHWLATAATLLFCIAIFSGVAAIATPAVALVAYAVCARVTRSQRPAQDPLNLVLTCLGIALTFYVFSDVARLDTIFGFNLAFACLAVAIAASFRPPLWALTGVVLVAYAALSLRTLIVPGPDPATLRFQGIAIVALIAVALVSGLARAVITRRPWVTTGGLSTLAGFLALAAAPT